jgi:hypothetical protein
MKDWNIYCLERSLFFATSIEQWSNDNPHRLRLTRKVNPYEIEDDHPACCLRLTARVVEKFVTGPKADKSKAGVYIVLAEDLEQIHDPTYRRIWFISPLHD